MKETRPIDLNNFTGQEKIKKQLNITIKAALQNNESHQHAIFYGNAGLGKTTLARILATEMGARCYSITAPAIKSKKELANVLLRLENKDILFIDEIHRLKIDIEEMLYLPIEDFICDISVGLGQYQRYIQKKLPKFTLIGATTIMGNLSKPLRDSFQLSFNLQYYTDTELKSIINKNAVKIGAAITQEQAQKIAARARGTPRIANNIFNQAMSICGYKELTSDSLEKAFAILEIDENGLKTADIKYLKCLAASSRAVGLGAIAATINESRNTIEEVIEPFLLYNNYCIRQSNGRVITEKGLFYK